MKASVERTALIEALGRAKKFAKGAPARPVLSHVKLSVNGTHKLELFATDTQMGLFQALPLEGEHQSGELCLPCAFLEKLVRRTGGEQITIERDGLVGKLNSGRDHFSVNGFDPDEFPVCPESSGCDLSVDSSEFAKAVRRILPFVDPGSASRYAINRIALEVQDGHMNLVGSDRKRIAWYRIKVPMNKLDMKLIPPAFFKEAGRLCGLGPEIAFRFSETQVIAGFGETRLSALLDTQGKFPDYRRVFEYGSKPDWVSLPLGPWIEALEKAGLYAQEPSRHRAASCRCEMAAGRGEARLVARNPVLGSAESVLPFPEHIFPEGGPVYCFDPLYFLSGLQVLEGERFELGLPQDPPNGVLGIREQEGAFRFALALAIR